MVTALRLCVKWPFTNLFDMLRNFLDIALEKLGFNYDSSSADSSIGLGRGPHIGFTNNQYGIRWI